MEKLIGGDKMKKLSKKNKFLKGFSSIKVGTICKNYGLDPANVQSGRTSEENISKVYNRLIKELLELIIDVYLNPEIEVINDERNTL